MTPQIKYSGGWFALTADISKFPALLVLLFSVIYTLCYKTYKFRFKNNILAENKKPVIVLGLISVLLYAASMMIYDYIVSLAMITVFVSGAFLMKKTFWKSTAYKEMILLEFIVLPIILLSFIALANPAVAGINSEIYRHVGAYRENITSQMPDSLKTAFENLSEKYKTLEDIQTSLQDTVRETLNHT